MTPRIEDNPYLALLARALGDAGVEVTLVPGPGLRWALTHGRRLDVLHLHWPEHLVRRRGSRTPRVMEAMRAVRLAAALALLRSLGVRVVWTVHNARPHESPRPRFDALVYRMVATLASCLVVHSRHAAAVTSKLLGKRKRTVVMPHGNYVGWYPPATRDRRDFRRELGIPDDAYLFLLFGQVRGYKNVPGVVEALLEIDDERVRLLIAGKPVPAELGPQVEAAAARDDRVVLRLGHVPDREVAEHHEAADAVVLPYAEIFSSGALMLALSYGLPVVCPRAGAAGETARAPAIAPFEPGRLPDAMIQAQRGDRHEQRAAALRAAAEASWTRSVECLLPAYAPAAREATSDAR
jgi:glycosyltransferase involved in cell wall biosynthesis